jgi:integrase
MGRVSIPVQMNNTGSAYRALWRADGRQCSLTFEHLPSAERFKTLLEDHGPDEALRVIELDEVGRHVPTVTEWLYTLTGVQPATLTRYRTYVRRDIEPALGSMPVSAVTETTIACWVKQLGGGKTIANKHGFISGAFQAAVRAGVMASNPCQGPRLPHTRVEEAVFLTLAGFKLLLNHIERDRWKYLPPG